MRINSNLMICISAEARLDAQLAERRDETADAVLSYLDKTLDKTLLLHQQRESRPRSNKCGGWQDRA